MNQQRYDAFRTARVMIATLPFDAAQQGVLFDAAEGMLLARNADDNEVAEYAAEISCILALGLAGEQLDDREAQQLTRQIERCGPGLQLEVERPETPQPYGFSAG